MAGAVVATSEPDSKTVNARRFAIKTDPARDALLTDFGKEP
jgi:ribonucleoside-diphosphate reductase alpha chain